jgi:hypothetical protein
MVCKEGWNPMVEDGEKSWMFLFHLPLATKLQDFLAFFFPFFLERLSIFFAYFLNLNLEHLFQRLNSCKEREGLVIRR